MSVARTILVWGAALALAAGTAQAQVAPAKPLAPPATRGALLYGTHCVACHNTQVHWRDQRIAKDWTGLRAQVARWQDRLRLDWSEADILEVTRHLNDTIYGLPDAARQQGRTPDGPQSTGRFKG